MSEEFFKQDTVPGLAPLPAPKTGPVPKQIGPYHVEGILSSGGMSRLYLAVHPETHDPLAIKLLLPQYVSHPEMKSHFLKEARIIQMSDHPNIVKLYDEGEWEGDLFIAMEFVQGISLRQFILHHTMSLERALDVILQIAAALTHLHAHGVIHRDIKPENILLTGDGGVKVIDFGIAQLSTQDERTPEGFMGTPVYMSPEQRENPLNVTFGSDIYSLAIVTYELVLGKMSRGEVHVSLMPKGLQPILAKALQPNPRERYTEVRQFAADLEAYRASDQFGRDERGASSLAEELKAAQESLLPSQIPDWHRVNLGVAVHKHYGLSGVYYEYFDLGNGEYGIALSEPTSKGVEGAVHAAFLQGILHGLGNQDPVEFVEKANELLCAQPFEEVFTLNFLILKPQLRQVTYLSCGYGPLFLLRSGAQRVEVVSSPNLALGIDPQLSLQAMTQNWNIGDTLILTTYRVGLDGKNEFEPMLEGLFYAPPQKQADGVLRRVLRASEGAPEQRPVVVISAHNTG
jgi:eukaryotic-like serine/threonine-protein kinase